MKTGSLTIEELVRAFIDLGGEAEWRDVQRHVAQNRNDSFLPYKDQANFDTTLWQLLYRHCPGFAKYTGKTLFQRVAESRYRLLDFDPRDSVLRVANAPDVNDWEACARRSREANEFARDQRLVRQLKEIHDSRCQICGARLPLPSGEAYAEIHHIRGLADGGPDTLGNMLCVCANCHALLDLKAIPLDLRNLRLAGNHFPGQEFLDHHNRLYRSMW